MSKFMKVLPLSKCAKHPQPGREELGFDKNDIGCTEVDGEEEVYILPVRNC